MRKYLAIYANEEEPLKQVVLEVSKRLGLSDEAPYYIKEDEKSGLYILVLSMEVLTKSVVDFFDEQGIELYQTSLVSKSEGLIGDLEEIAPDYVTVQPKEDENDGIVDSPRVDLPHIQGDSERGNNVNPDPYQTQEEVTQNPEDFNEDEDSGNVSFMKIMDNIGGFSEEEISAKKKQFVEEQKEEQGVNDEPVAPTPESLASKSSENYADEQAEIPLSAPVNPSDKQMGDNTPTPQPEPQQAPEQPQVPVNEATETNNGEQTPQEISKPANKIDKKRLKKLLIGVGVVALVGVTLYGVTSFMTHDSKPKTEVTQKKETPKKHYALTESEYKRNVKTLAKANIGLYLNNDNELSGTITVTTESGNKRVKKLIEYTKDGEFVTEDVETSENFVYSKDWVDKLLVTLQNKDEKGDSSNSNTEQSSSTLSSDKK